MRQQVPLNLKEILSPGFDAYQMSPMRPEKARALPSVAGSLTQEPVSMDGSISTIFAASRWSSTNGFASLAAVSTGLESFICVKPATMDFR